jgi:hypothetical protein
MVKSTKRGDSEMPQNRETGRAANSFGHRIAKVVADKLALEFIGHPTSNQCKGPKGVGVIKSARTSTYIGILKSMLPELDVVYAVIKADTNTYQVFEISREEFDKFKFNPSAEKSKHMWFMKVRDIKTFRPILTLAIPNKSESERKAISSPVGSEADRSDIQDVESRIRELFKKYNDVLDELRELKVISSTNNPAGDYGEYLAEKMLELTRAPKSSKGYDLTDDRDRRYQVKTRRPTPHNRSRQLGGFRDLDEKLFDSCLAIILSPDFKLEEMWEIPHEIICRYARNTTRGFRRVVLDGQLLKETRVKRHF